MEYAKADAEDILIKITVANRGPDIATLRLLPTVWFRNTWSWGGGEPRPELHQVQLCAKSCDRTESSAAWQPLAVLRRLARTAVHRKRDQRPASVWRRKPNTLRQRRHQRLHRSRHKRSGQSGTFRHQGGGPLQAYRRRRRNCHGPAASDADSDFKGKNAFDSFRQDFRATPAGGRRILRDSHSARSFAGRAECDAPGLCRHAVVQAVLSLRDQATGCEGDPGNPPPPPERRNGRNHEWTHLYNADVISMPDKWEYPVVCGVGSGVSLHPAGAGGSRFRQGAAHPHAARVVHAPERANSRL